MSGKVSWRIDELAQVAEFLGVPITALIGSEPPASKAVAS